MNANPLSEFTKLLAKKLVPTFDKAVNESGRKMQTLKVDGGDATAYFEGTREKFAGWLHSSESNLALAPPLNAKLYEKMIEDVDY